MSDTRLQVLGWLRRHADPVRRSALSSETAPQTMTNRALNVPYRMTSREMGPGLAWYQSAGLEGLQGLEGGGYARVPQAAPGAPAASGRRQRRGRRAHHLAG